MSQFLMFMKLGFVTATYPLFCTMSWNILLFFFEGFPYSFIKSGDVYQIKYVLYRRDRLNLPKYAIFKENCEGTKCSNTLRITYKDAIL